jgi:hypothetical protein
MTMTTVACIPSLPQLLASVPDIVWAAIAGALLTIIGVALTNRSNLQQLKERLRQEATQKDADRISALRKDVYLKLPLELSNALAYLADLPRRDLRVISSDEGVKGYARIASQVSVISLQATADAVQELNEKIVVTYARMMKRLQRVQAARTEIEKTQVGSVERDVKQSEFGRMLLDEIKWFYEQVPEINPLIAKALTQVRLEIGFNVDIERFERNMLDRAQRMIQEVISLMPPSN